uniref:Putative secreted protein n=1 Tax=Anopheles triannulatus TaxID=58253 RepID=A0A2M4B642_9DIPT
MPLFIASLVSWLSGSVSERANERTSAPHSPHTVTSESRITSARSSSRPTPYHISERTEQRARALDELAKRSKDLCCNEPTRRAIQKPGKAPGECNAHHRHRAEIAIIIIISLC